MTTYAIIPARGGSQGIPGKNLREIGGEPLVSIAARQAIAAEEIEHVVVNSDDPAIRAAVSGYDVDVRDRPERYARGDRMMGVDTFLKWQVSQLEQEGSHVEVVVLLYPTAPLRPVDVIDETVRRVTVDGFDSALTLYEDDRYLWEVNDDIAAPSNYDPSRRGPRQLETWNQWVENKAVYVMTRDLLISTGCRLGGSIGYVSMSPLRSVDIDTPDDLELARQIAGTDGKSW
jgi:N-acylneuraminate cytidylyltransferase